MNSKTLFNQIADQIALMETKDEIQAIVFLLLEGKLGLSQTDILTEKEIPLTTTLKEEINVIIERVNSSEPIQYILGNATFFGRKFNVNPHVLIPRPETEELVQTVISFHNLHPEHAKPYRDYGHTPRPTGSSFRILDIGTGSGCIAITLKLEIPQAEVFAVDLMDGALTTAKQNADQLKTPVSFSKLDILRGDITEDKLDVIVSNPPYIRESEKESLKRNVIDYEPHEALFVPTSDPLLFYEAISSKGYEKLKDGGRLFVECNEKLASKVATLFRKNGYRDTAVYDDLSNKPRIVSAIK